MAAIIFYLAATLAGVAASAVLDAQLKAVGQQITDDYRKDVLSHFLSFEARRLSGFTSGEILTRLDEDTEGLFKYYYILFYKLMGSGLALVSVLAVLCFESLWLCAGLLLVSVLSILLFKIIQDRGVPKYIRHTAAMAEFNGTVKENLDNAATLRAVNGEIYAQARVVNALKTRYRNSLPAFLMYNNLWAAATVMEGMVITVGLVFALLLWDAGAVTVGTVYLIYNYSTLITSPLQDFRNHMGEMQGARAGMQRTQELLETGVVESGNTELLKRPLSLEIEDLSFCYSGQEKVLKNITLMIKSGEKIGIMGQTGCGKSTLINIVSGLNSYELGSVRLDGAELKTVSAKSRDEVIAHCTQQVQLIHGSLRDNIGLYKYDDSEIISAIKRLDLWEWFQKFQDGLDTQLDMGELSVSSGEAQLIALTRLALREPGLILLDEITSGLDPQTEKSVIAATARLCKNATVVAIAHNASSLQWMDRVITMEKGELL